MAQCTRRRWYAARICTLHDGISKAFHQNTGGQLNAYDLHKNAFDFEYFRDILLPHGFGSITKIERFGMFPDSSELTIGHTAELLSVNVWLVG